MSPYNNISLYRIAKFQSVNISYSTCEFSQVEERNVNISILFPFLFIYIITGKYYWKNRGDPVDDLIKIVNSHLRNYMIQERVAIYNPCGNPELRNIT